VLDRLRPLFAPVDIASLAFFRIAFGAIMLWDVQQVLSQGWVTTDYAQPPFHFSYPGFGWIEPWPGDGMTLHFYVMGALALCMMLGLMYRLSATLFFLAFTYVFLLDAAYYRSHVYFAALVSFLMIFVPAHRAFSLDVGLRELGWRRDHAPAWSLWILRAQMGFAYFFAGVARLNGEWLRGYMSWAGMLLDLLIVPALLWRRTRPYALVAAVLFQGMRAYLFGIDIFPWLAIAATLLFCEPEWPRRLARRLRRAPSATDAGPAVPVVFGPRQKWIGVGLVVWVAIQIALPLRPYLHAGDPNWTEEGHRFSWRQMLRSKWAQIEYVVTDPETGRSWTLDPRPHLADRQLQGLLRSPDLMLEFAHHIAEEDAKVKGRRPVVRARVLLSLNGREPQAAVDETVDLAAEPRRTLTPYPWIIPLEIPLEAQWDGESPPTHPATLAAIERIRQRAEAKVAARRQR
jgi:hypothetical protein